MRFDKTMSDQAALTEIGRRLAQLRLAQNVSQEQLAERAGIGVVTLKRLELGRSTTTTTIVRVLRALGRLETLELAFPEPAAEPARAVAARKSEPPPGATAAADAHARAGSGRPWLAVG